MLLFIGGFGSGNEPRPALVAVEVIEPVVEPRIGAALHSSTVPHAIDLGLAGLGVSSAQCQVCRPRRSNAPRPTNASTTGPAATLRNTSITSRRTRSPRARSWAATWGRWVVGGFRGGGRLGRAPGA